MNHEAQLKCLRLTSLAFFLILCFFVWTAFCDARWSELYQHYEPWTIKYPTNEAAMSSAERWFYAIVVFYNLFGGLWILLDWVIERYERGLSPVFGGSANELNEVC